MDSNKHIRGQVSVETLVLVGFVIAFMIPVVLVFLTVSNVSSENVAIGQARITAKQIGSAAGEVYAQGIKSKRILLANMPPNVQNITIGNYEVVITLRTSKGQLDVVENTFANVTDGPVPLGNSSRFNTGLREILVESKGNNVEIGYTR